MSEGNLERSFGVTTPPKANSPDWLTGGKGRDEDANWTELDKAKAKNDLFFLRLYGFITLSLTALFTILFAASLCVWACHYLLPEDWRWLPVPSLEKIQSVLFSGGLGAVISSMAQRQIAKS